MACCRPHICCSPSSREPTEKDSCMCGCAYLNGGLQGAIVHGMLILGFFCSVAGLGDCAFVTLTESIMFPLEDGGADPDEMDLVDRLRFRRVGYLTFEKLDGRCYFYDDGSLGDVEDQLRFYFNFLGSDWQLGRIFGCIVIVAVWFTFLYSISFCCAAQVRAVRYFLGFLLSVILTIFQGLTMLVFASNFCSNYGCVLDRSAGFSIAATCCYFLSGVSFFCMCDYPGARAIEAMAAKKKDGDDIESEEIDPKEDTKDPEDPEQPQQKAEVKAVEANEEIKKEEIVDVEKGETNEESDPSDTVEVTKMTEPTDTEDPKVEVVASSNGIEESNMEDTGADNSAEDDAVSNDVKVDDESEGHVEVFHDEDSSVDAPVVATTEKGIEGESSEAQTSASDDVEKSLSEDPQVNDNEGGNKTETSGAAPDNETSEEVANEADEYIEVEVVDDDVKEANGPPNASIVSIPFDESADKKTAIEK